MKKPWLGLITLATALWLITLMPIMAGYLNAYAQRAYVARIPVIAADTMAYYSNIEQAREGQMLFSNQYTSEVQRPTLFHPIWLVAGWVGNVFHLPTPWAYQVVRWMAILAFLVLLESIVCSFTTNTKQKWLILIFITTCSGLGWLLSPGQSGEPIEYQRFTPDIWVAESNTFQSIGHSALFIGTQAMMLLIFWRFWQWTSARQPKLSIWLGPLMGLLFLVHPYDILTMGAVIVAWIVVCLFRGQFTTTQLWYLLRHGAWWVACLIPVLVYFLYFVLPEPAMGGWLKQNIDTTSPWPLVLIGYGLLWPMAFGGWWAWRRRQPLVTFLLVWMIVGLLLIYMPGLAFQRRLMSGLHLPIAILAGAGLLSLTTSLIKKWSIGLVMFGIITVLSITNIQNSIADVLGVIYPKQAEYPVYITRDQREAIDWLHQHTTLNDVIFSEVWMGNTIAGMAGRTVVQGHGHQTVDFQMRLRDWAAFQMNDLSVDERAALLSRLRVTWLFWREPDATHAAYQPEHDPRWQRQYANKTVTIYELQPNGAE